MLKRIIALLVLTMYLHGMSGYSMSFHKCSSSGIENVFASYDTIDPCGESDNDCNHTGAHFEKGNCCEMHYTVVSIDDDSNISSFKSAFFNSAISHSILSRYSYSNISSPQFPFAGLYTIRPPEPSRICVFRI